LLKDKDVGFSNGLVSLCVLIIDFVCLQQELSARLETAMNDLKAADAKIERRVEEAGEQFARELKRERDAWAAAEKVRIQVIG
jgi:hypothetical protein